jgi:hypothetical protein
VYLCVTVRCVCRRACVCVQSPRVDTPPLNHIGLWVDDLEAAVKHLTESGVRFTPGGIRKGAAGHNVIFIHPKVRNSAQGGFLCVCFY